MYSPELGTFLEQDPIGTAGGVNLYEYCGDDPLTRTDAMGLDAGTDFPCHCPPDPSDLKNPNAPGYAVPDPAGGWTYPHFSQYWDGTEWVDDPQYGGYQLHCDGKKHFLYVTHKGYCFGRCPYPEPDEPQQDDPNRRGVNRWIPWTDPKTGKPDYNKFTHCSTNPTTLERICTDYAYDPKTNTATITITLYKCPNLGADNNKCTAIKPPEAQPALRIQTSYRTRATSGRPRRSQD